MKIKQFKELVCILFFLVVQNCFSQIAITEVLYNTRFDEQPLKVVNGSKEYYTFKNKVHHLGEFIELYNYTTEDIPLGGWTLVDNGGTYVFDKNVVIKPNEYLILAYRDLKNKADIGDYFPVFYPNIKGKKGNIIYQDMIILNNRKDGLSLYASELAGLKLAKKVLITSVFWDNRGNGIKADGFDDKTYQALNGRDFYTSSLQLQAAELYSEIKATPMTANYVPKTQRLLDIYTVERALLDNSSGIDWSRHVREILDQVCNLNIPLVQQYVKGSFNKGELCFVHDAAGNYLRTEPCKATRSLSIPISEVDNVKDNNLIDNNLNITEIKKYIVVYPNPTSGFVKVSFDEIVYGKIIKFEVFSATGASILKKTINPSTKEIDFDITYYPTGVYVLKFSLSSGETFSVNIIKR